MNQENQMIEIDVLSLLKTIWKRKFLIILTALLTGILALGYSVFIAKPAYKSTTRIYVVNRQQGENPTLTNQDLQAGSYLVKDYKEIILSQDVLASVISELKLSITVTHADPAEASRIANTLREVAAEKIIAVTKVSDVTTLEEAETPKTPSSPNIRRNTIIGVLAGGVLMVLVIVSVEILDDRVKKPEDIEETLGMTLLGVIPDMSKVG